MISSFKRNSQKGSLLIFLAVSLIFFKSCKKEVFINSASPTETLSVNSQDITQRLAEIRRKYDSKNLANALIPNKDKKLSWTPDWKHPEIQKINDSVSYVLFRLLGKVNMDGKSHEAREIGVASYLIVKNENEFYKGLYFLPKHSEKTATINFSPKHFTGDLLLKNLQSKQSYLLHYSNGKAIQKRNSTDNTQRSASTTVEGWQTQCRTEMQHCTYVSSGSINCTGTIYFEIIYSRECYWPSPVCGVHFYLSDFTYEFICEDFWFDDPPGQGGGIEVDLENPEEAYEKETFADSVDLENRLDCFDAVIDDANTTYNIKICSDLPNDANPNALLGPDRVGHAFITLTKTNGSHTVTQTFGFYPEKGYKSLWGIPVNSQIEDDGLTNHQYNASYSRDINQFNFQTVINTAVTYSKLKYNLSDMNCTDYALAVFNSGVPVGQELVILDWTISGTYTFTNYGTTPSGLYKKIKELETNYNIGASTVTGNAPTSVICN